MSRWSKAFAAFSGGSDTLDTVGHSGDQHPTVSQSVDSVTATLAPYVTRMAAAPGAAVRGEFKPEHKAVVQDDGATCTLWQCSRCSAHPPPVFAIVRLWGAKSLAGAWGVSNKKFGTTPCTKTHPSLRQFTTGILRYEPLVPFRKLEQTYLHAISFLIML